MADYIYLVQMDIPVELEDEFNRVYDTEHVWWETFEREAPKRESMVTAGVGRNCARRVENEKYLSRSPIPAHCSTSG